VNVVESFGGVSFLVGSLGSESSTFSELDCVVVLSIDSSVILSSFGDMSNSSKLSFLLGFVNVSYVSLGVTMLGFES